MRDATRAESRETDSASAVRSSAPASSAGASASAAAEHERVIARLGPGDHFGETALLEERNVRNATVRCVSPACELRAMPNEKFAACLRESSQLAASVHAAAEARTNRRVRKVLRAAEEAGKASLLTVPPGEVIFRQGDRSSAFYLIESGEVQMTLTPAETEDEAEEEAMPIPIRRYKPGECFGASGLLPGDGYRRNTATAVGAVTLKVIPHNHFRVMIKDDSFLKAGLQAAQVLHSKRQQAEQAGGTELAKGVTIAGEIFDELEDEVVMKTMRK